jgi:hypothetical protein
MEHKGWEIWYLQRRKRRREVKDEAQRMNLKELKQRMV